MLKTYKFIFEKSFLPLDQEKEEVFLPFVGTIFLLHNVSLFCPFLFSFLWEKSFFRMHPVLVTGDGLNCLISQLLINLKHSLPLKLIEFFWIILTISSFQVHQINIKLFSTFIQVIFIIFSWTKFDINFLHYNFISTLILTESKKIYFIRLYFFIETNKTLFFIMNIRAKLSKKLSIRHSYVCISLYSSCYPCKI